LAARQHFVTDGLVSLSSPEPGDAARLIAARDEEFLHWLGPGADEPRPFACIEVRKDIVGWVDFDTDHDWLQPGEVNIGYNIFPGHRRYGYATRSVQLLLHHLALRTSYKMASLLINSGNERSLAVARRLGLSPSGEVGGEFYFKRFVPPLAYSDGVVTIRRQELEDLDADLEAKDGEQIKWLWEPGQREKWQAMSPAEQREHAASGLKASHDTFGTGPKWAFSVDAHAGLPEHAGPPGGAGHDIRYVAYVDCDLANEIVQHGEANISYSAHPAYRGKGYVSRAVRLVTQWLRDNTGAREAHIIVDSRNAASLRVARAVEAPEAQRWIGVSGHTMVRHVLNIRAEPAHPTSTPA